ncbi:putative transcriptional regulatory protein [Colletotrichum trifolii]|uniref:Putative transcriptional regulatory protein n=1 Tax=Colletotrichum trifolii TaxID=5466 RepID=A0A4R8QQ59_COLTR|nr:putative transcriptional regulatory protein [Colletotrichum trifolii]
MSPTSVQIRCSRTYPCANCAAASVKCEFRESDFKRPPVSREYVATLESRVASLEGFLAKLKAASSDERNHMLDEVEMRDYIPSFASLPPEEESALSDALMKASLQESPDGTMVYFGPTSVFQDQMSSARASPSVNSKPSPYQEDRSMLVNDTIVLCINLFFHWQHPLFMFIDREAFLTDFEENPVEGEFCSPPLIFGCAALGALMSKDPEIKSKAQAFAETAQHILTTEGLNCPRPITVQAFLLVGYYEAGIGQLSRGWLSAGTAFRMGQDIGFQRDPTYWGEVDSQRSSSLTKQFHRHVYWGCYVADKIYSLFLGRPAVMHENDGDVSLVEEPPQDSPIWENWLATHNLERLKDVDANGPSLTLLFNQQIELGRIVDDMLSTTFAPRKRTDAHARKWTEVSLNKLNARLVAWHEALPSNMRWKKWFTNKDVLEPGVAILHVFYHATRLCLNLPFITAVASIPSLSEEAADESGQDPLVESFRICKSGAQVMMDILQRFRNQHTLHRAPMLFIGASLLSMKAIMVTSRHEGVKPPLCKGSALAQLDAVLAELGPTWSLANEVRLKFISALNPDGQPGFADAESGAEPPHGTGGRGAPDGSGSTTTGTSIPLPAHFQQAAAGILSFPPVIDPFGEVPQQPVGLEGLGPQVWPVAGAMGYESTYWPTLSEDFLVDANLGFFDSTNGFDWPNEPSIP